MITMSKAHTGTQTRGVGGHMCHSVDLHSLQARYPGVLVFLCAFVCVSLSLCLCFFSVGKISI